MNLLADNWIWILVIVFVGIHLLGHRGHGHHRHGGRMAGQKPARTDQPRRERDSHDHAAADAVNMDRPPNGSKPSTGAQRRRAF